MAKRRDGVEDAIRRMDYLALKLINLDDAQFVKSVFDINKLREYERVPEDIANRVADIFEERLKELEEIEEEYNEA